MNSSCRLVEDNVGEDGDQSSESLEKKSGIYAWYAKFWSLE